MNPTNPKTVRVSAISPSTRGFGFAVLEGNALVDWGVKSVKGEKNSECLLKVEAMITHYQPGVMVLEDGSVKGSRRAPRIQALSQEIIELAKKRKVTVKLFSRNQVRKVFFAHGKGTKHAVAEILAKRFPEELGSRLPPKRKPWKSEDHRMAIFDAVALALMPRLMKRF